jgi:hypothetical protein
LSVFLQVALETEIAKLTSEIKDLRVQLHEKHVKASKAAADAAAMEALEGEKVGSRILHISNGRDNPELTKLICLHRSRMKDRFASRTGEEGRRNSKVAGSSQGKGN